MNGKMFALLFKVDPYYIKNQNPIAHLSKAGSTGMAHVALREGFHGPCFSESGLPCKEKALESYGQGGPQAGGRLSLENLSAI